MYNRWAQHPTRTFSKLKIISAKKTYIQGHSTKKVASRKKPPGQRGQQEKGGRRINDRSFAPLGIPSMEQPSSSSAPHDRAHVDGADMAAAVPRSERDVPMMQLTRQLIHTYNKINQVRFLRIRPDGGRQELRNVRGLVVAIRWWHSLFDMRAEGYVCVDICTCVRVELLRKAQARAGRPAAAQEEERARPQEGREEQRRLPVSPRRGGFQRPLQGRRQEARHGASCCCCL